MRFLLLVGAVLLSSSLAQADLGPRPGPRPQPQPQPQMPVVKSKVSIEVDAKATEARLIVPMQILFGGGNFGFGGGAIGFGGGVGAIGGGAQGVGGAQSAGGAIGVGGGFGVQGNPPPPQQQPKPEKQPLPKKMSSLPFSTIVVGLSLTLALSFGGLWLVRKKNGNGGGLITPLLVLVAIMGVSMMSGAVWANRAPPFVQPQPPNPPPAFPAMLKLDGIKVELVPQGDTVRLILTSKQKDLVKASK